MVSPSLPPPPVPGSPADLPFPTAASGGVYCFVKDAAANLRQVDDHYNSAIGGGLAGAVVGLARKCPPGLPRGSRRLTLFAEKSMPRVFGFGAGMAVLLSAANYTGGLKGNKDKEADEFSRKEAMRMNRRRPIEETLAEVGEGRCERYTPSPVFDDRNMRHAANADCF